MCSNHVVYWFAGGWITLMGVTWLAFVAAYSRRYLWNSEASRD